MTIVSLVRLGPYEILSPIGAGGMGEVYRARDTRSAPLRSPLSFGTFGGRSLTR